MTKKFLFVLRKPAYSGLYVQEMLDIILTTAAFEQPVSVLFLDDGVFHLKNHQRAENSGYKNAATLFSMLPIMDVEALFVETESLLAHGISQKNLTLPVTVLPRDGLAPFMAAFDVVFSG